MNDRATTDWRIAGLLGTAALDLLIVLELLAPSPSGARVAALLFLHVGVALGAAAILTVLVPQVGRQNARAFGTLCAAIGLFLPVVGAAGLYLTLRLGWNVARSNAEGPWLRVPVDLDLEDPRWRPRSHRHDLSVTALSELLQDRAPENAEHRFQALLRMKHLPPRPSVILLKLALKDPSDEVRLFAFSRIERMRDELEQAVKGFRAALAATVDDETRARVHLRLAETHWEIAYVGLAEGAVLEHALNAALDHATKCCRLGEQASAEYLRGRILLQRRDDAAAAEAFQRALDLGHPESKVLPYLAECAFRSRSIDRVRALLQDLEKASRGDAPLGAVLEFWR